MKVSRLLLCLTVTVLCGTVIAAPVISPDNITETTLDNGLHIVVKNDPTWPVVSMGMYIRAGTFHEGPETAGAAHMVEHMLFEAETDNGEKLAPHIERIGGRISASTLRDFTHVNVTVSENFVEDVLPNLCEAVLDARFDSKALEREKEVVAREMAERTESGTGFLTTKTWELAFEDHPYGRPIGGTAEQVEALTIDTLRAFYDRFYVPNNMSLIVAGQVDPNWLIARVRELTAEKQSRPVDWQPPQPESAQDSIRKEIKVRESKITGLSFAWHAPGMPDYADICAMDVIYTILGQQHIGRIHKALQADEVPALVECDYLTQRQPGLMIVTAGIQGNSETTVRRIILEQINQLREETVSEKELQRAKRILRTEYAFSNESYFGQVGSMGFYDAIDTYQFAIDYIGHVQQISAEDVRRVARKYLDPDAYTLVILRPSETPGGSQEVNL